MYQFFTYMARMTLTLIGIHSFYILNRLK